MGGKPRSLSQTRLLWKRRDISRRAVASLHRQLFPEHFIAQKLKEFERASENEISYWQVSNRYLENEREKRSDEILSAFRQSAKQALSLRNQSRIVRTMHGNDPLCAFGSVRRPPGQRFNFGQTTQISSSYFCGLYIASNYETSFQEVYHSTEESPGDFTHVLVDVEIENYIDLTEDTALQKYLAVINSIEMPDEYLELAEHLNVVPLSLVKNVRELRSIVFSENFKVWDARLDQFAPSQWIGKYIREAGIPAIRYPSVRNDGGINICVFPENLRDSNSKVMISNPSENPNIPSDRIEMNGENGHIFCHPLNHCP